MKAFLITADRIDTHQTRQLRFMDAPEGGHGITKATIKTKLPFRFRLYDDDGVLYYEGRASCHEAIEAAHDWAMAYAGCTTSKIFEGNKLASFIG